MIILLNGPPGSGKDTAAEFITLMLGNSQVMHEKMSWPMKRGLTTIFSFNDAERKALNAYKDHSNGPEFADMSWRLMEIDMYHYLARRYGKDILGRLLMRRNRDNAKRHTVISDAGRNDEIVPIVKGFSYGQVGYIELHREGCNFDNDIREYLDHKHFKHVEVIENKYDLEMFQAQIRKVLRKWELLDGGDN